MRNLLFLLLPFLALNFACSSPDTSTPNSSAKTPDSLADEPRETPPPQPTVDAYWDDLAHLLAGLPADSASTLAEFHELPAVISYGRRFDQTWKTHNSKLLSKLDAWRKTELAAWQADTQRVFYPFSGPDLLTAGSLFPQASSYILFGLEAEGQLTEVRDLEPQQLTANLKRLERSLDDIFRLTFFKTNDMRVDLKANRLNGTLPILLAFAARLDYTVLNVHPVELQANGQFSELAESPKRFSPDDSTVTGVKLVLQKGKQGRPQELIYISTNVKNAYYPRQRGLDSCLAQYGPAATYVKSASYLMHYTNYSLIRDRVLALSSVLVQDDTGVPVKYLPEEKWEARLYGKYVRPIPLFKNRYQPQLARMYNEPGAARQLNFELGYNAQARTTPLMVFVRK